MNQQEAAAYRIGVIVGACSVLIIVIVIGVFFLLTLQKALTRCSRRNRTMEPAMVWLNLIPLFNYVWFFVTVIKVGDSLRNEFIDRRMDRGGDYGKSLGIGMAAFGLANGVLSNFARFGRVPLLGLLTIPISLGVLVAFVVYWVNIAGYSRRLHDDDRLDDDDDDDDLDDLPPHRSGRPDERIRDRS